ncbi:MAG: hypothetical protein IPP49_14555 [Saprospiraceae bacterium]|nr:hypothetical protein [Saprospiraceae bacterium]
MKRLFWVLLIAFFAFSAAFYFYRTYTISEGTRTGILYKISKKGKLFKTYEGQLQLAGVTIMNKESSFEFSVENENIYSSMQNLEGKNVRLHYKQLINAFPWQGILIIWYTKWKRSSKRLLRKAWLSLLHRRHLSIDPLIRLMV